MFYRRDLRVEAAPDAFVAIRCFRSASSKDIICYHVLVTEFENNEKRSAHGVRCIGFQFPFIVTWLCDY